MSKARMDSHFLTLSGLKLLATKRPKTWIGMQIKTKTRDFWPELPAPEALALVETLKTMTGGQVHCKLWVTALRIQGEAL